MKKAARTFVPLTHRRDDSFSLIELLVVLAVIAVLAGLALPSLTGMTRGQSMQHAGDAVANALMVARENALTKNRPVSVRFIQSTGPGGQTGLFGLQSWIINDANVATPLTKVTWLPDGMSVAANGNLSPLLTVNNGTMQVSGVSRPYFGFNFLATGAPNTNAYTFVTVVGLKDISAATPPVNFRAVWINPVTGEIRTFAP